MNTPSILIVDDEPNNFDVIEVLLSNQGYQMHYAPSGAAAINHLDTFQPDLILLDVMMPGMDGIEVCKQIKTLAQWQAVPIVMVTALSSKSDLAECLAAGANDFISKPVNAIELRARVKSMLRIKQQYDDLQGLLKLREDMIRMVIHDLRNPLSTILLGLELLEVIDYSRDQQKQKLTQITTAAEELHLLIDDILQIALLESGKLRLNQTSIDLSDLVKSSVSSFEVIAQQKAQTLNIELGVDGQVVPVDGNMMRRTIDNLISNAIKFSPQNSAIQIRLSRLNSGDHQIQVIDSGPGIPEPLQQKIFEQYEVGTMMPNIAQIGLGLAFCKMVIEAHGGHIEASNHPKTGSIFTITLPMGEPVGLSF
ncbi:hybrid sensor histidine kinase/response regulator [filamentous cyanobacterium LEGE 11480]|uniref:histidine kinase n=1 Tax=Romeriopsis navalis LEGE 11480 TaxID=2777977 RepID=A0A928Z2V6_9CYAN|nr:hybrid sensor histidine kinase/response regulator [Romeriopsis navalis]MBE9028533.1 hybrid sensor histidine kinase/response regulator [Romeriopsis navalis LEGE 11480]